MFGAVEVLVPLRINDLGGGHAVIAAGFILGAAIGGQPRAVAGRYSDRVGRRGPFVVGLIDRRRGDGGDRRCPGDRHRPRRACFSLRWGVASASLRR